MNVISIKIDKALEFILVGGKTTKVKINISCEARRTKKSRVRRQWEVECLHFTNTPSQEKASQEIDI